MTTQDTYGQFVLSGKTFDQLATLQTIMFFRFLFKAEDPADFCPEYIDRAGLPPNLPGLFGADAVAAHLNDLNKEGLIMYILLRGRSSNDIKIYCVASSLEGRRRHFS